MQEQLATTYQRPRPWNKGKTKFDTREPGNYRKLLVSLSPKLKSELLEMSDEESRSMSDIIREAIKDYQRKRLLQKAELKRAGVEPSLIEQAASRREGPLVTTQAYLPLPVPAV
jgi:predicted transcriptional regulator